MDDLDMAAEIEINDALQQEWENEQMAGWEPDEWDTINANEADDYRNDYDSDY